MKNKYRYRYLRKQKVKLFGDDSATRERYIQSQQLKLEKQGAKRAWRGQQERQQNDIPMALLSTPNTRCLLLPRTSNLNKSNILKIRFTMEL